MDIFIYRVSYYNLSIGSYSSYCNFNFLFWFVGKVYQERNNYILWKHNRKKKWSYEILTRIKSFGKLGKFVKKKNFVLLFISKCIYNIFI